MSAQGACACGRHCLLFKVFCEHLTCIAMCVRRRYPVTHCLCRINLTSFVSEFATQLAGSCADMPAVICDRCACFTASSSAPRIRKEFQSRCPVRCCTSATEAQGAQGKATENSTASAICRRTVLSASFASIPMLMGLPAQAVQGYTAGRIPGTASSQSHSASQSSIDKGEQLVPLVQV